MKKGLFALALGTFTLGIAEFIIEGIIYGAQNEAYKYLLAENVANDLRFS